MKKTKTLQEKNITKKLPDRLIKDISNAEDIMNAIGDGISILDRNFHILYENQAHRDMMGIHAGEFCYNAYSIRQGICDGCPVALTFKDGKVHTVERAKQTEYETKYLQITASPLKNSEGKIIAGIRVVRDITGRKLLEEEIREREGKYRSLSREFRGILDAIPDALVLLSSNLEVVWSNEIAAKNMNMSVDDFIGQHCYKVRHGRSAPCEMCPVLECFTTHKPKIIESKTPDGRTWELHVYPVFGDRGEVKGVIEAAHNITDRKRAEEALRESETKYRTLVENIPQKIFTKDRHSVYISCNENYANDLGITPEEIIGKTDFDFFPKELAEKYRFDDKRVMDTGKTEGIEEHYIQDNEKAWIYTVKTPIRDKDGNIEGIMGVFSDITERKQAEQEKKKLEEQLLHAQKMEAVGQLAGGVAHDFNNLLTGILGYTYLMLVNTEKSHPFYEKLKIIEQQVVSGSELTKQLLGFARGGKYDVRPVNINDVIIETSDIFGRTKKEITIHRKLQQDLHTVEADSGQIKQVLLNLFVNAWQAMPSGGNLYIETQNVILDEQQCRAYNAEPGPYIKIAVTDTGVGMDPETQKRIFEPFFSTKGVGKGTGLGLASAYGIIRNHRGIINVYSEKGHGSSFNLYLPVSGAKAAETQQTEGDLLTGQETILIVDDEPINIAVVKDLLETLGYKIMTAQSGLKAIELYREHSGEIQLVILDMIMPEMNGKETLIKLREIDEKVRVLLSSGYSMNGEAAEILAIGCKGFIQKPLMIEELSRKIRDVLDSKDS